VGHCGSRDRGSCGSCSIRWHILPEEAKATRVNRSYNSHIKHLESPSTSVLPLHDEYDAPVQLNVGSHGHVNIDIFDLVIAAGDCSKSW
jgi:hypothetical protein